MNEENEIDIVGILAFVGIVALVFTIAFCSIVSSATGRLAKQALVNQKPMRGEVLWLDIEADFKSSEYVNVSTAECWKFSSTKKDFNKSKIIGRYAGQKFVEAKEGFLKGILDPRKHKKE